MSTQGISSIDVRRRGFRRAKCAALALAALGACIVAMLVSTSTPAAAATEPTVTFTLLTPLPTELAIGESATIGVRVQSSEPFLMAIALSDAYFPGRSVRFDGSSAQPGATSADLYLTLTATGSTAGLPAAETWPYDENWRPGVAPLAVRVGARFTGGRIVGASYAFSVTVP